VIVLAIDLVEQWCGAGSSEGEGEKW